MTTRGCSKCKCKTTDHDLRGCDNKWPFWEDQVCDRCLNCHDHDYLKCPLKRESILSCKICGHEGHHNTSHCTIKDPTKENQLRQWTEIKYEAHMSELSRAVNSAPPPPNRTVAKVWQRTQFSGAESRSQAQPSGSRSRPQANIDQVTQQLASTTLSNTNPPDPANTLGTDTIFRRAKELPEVAGGKTIRDQKTSTDIFTAVRFNVEPRRDIKILTNCFAMTQQANWLFYKYRIHLGLVNGKRVTKPEVIRALIYRLLHIQRPPAPGITFVSDYLSLVYSNTPLYPEFDHQADFEPWHIDHQLSPKPGHIPPIMTTTFVFEGRCTRQNLDDYYGTIPNGQRTATYHPDQDIRALNVLALRNVNLPNLFTGGIVGKKFYPEPFANAIPLIHGNNIFYVISRGYYSSVRRGPRGWFLNINPTMSAFFPNTTTLQTWILYHGPVPTGVPILEVQSLLRHLRVTFAGDPTDLRGQRKKRIIFGFPGKVRDQDFPRSETDPTRVNVLTHMQTRYPLLAFDGDACCINCGSTDAPKYYSADQLTLIEWQPLKGVLDNHFSEQMVRSGQIYPEQCKGSITTHAFGPLGIQSPTGALQPLGLQQTPNYNLTYLQQFGFRVSSQFLELDARLLPPPTVQFGNSQRNLAQNDTGYKGSWSFRQAMSVRQGPIDIGFIGIGVADGTGIQAFITCLLAELVTCGYNQNQLNVLQHGVQFIARPNVAGNAALHTWVETTLHQHFVTSFTNPTAIFVILDQKSPTLYPHLKWWSDCMAGIPMICVTHGVSQKYRVQHPRTLVWRQSRDMAQNLALKLNLKLGGISHRLKDHLDCWGAMTRTMIVGADVTHPGRSKDCPSMAGVVATSNATTPYFLSSARLQSPNQESIDQLGDMIKERLDAWYARNVSQPHHILFYRDGVSESQFLMVKEVEIPRIEAGCRAFGATHGQPDWLPNITLLVVVKRHHIRFYPRIAGTDSRDRNLECGLIVDSQITSPERCDFFLQSHDSPLGTARGAHYIVLRNDTNYPMEELEKVTNNLCFIGVRGIKSLSICTPALYADKLCDRLRCYMKTYLDTRLANTRPPPPPTAVQTRATDVAYWGRQPSLVPGRRNPWHPNLDNIMFYL